MGLSRDLETVEAFLHCTLSLELLHSWCTLNSTFYIICGILFLLFVMLLHTLQLYKHEFSRHTHLNAGFLVLVACLLFSLTFSSQLKATFLGFIVICWIFPLVYSLYYLLHWLYLQRKKTKRYAASLLSCLCSHCVPAYENVEESLLHRIIHSHRHDSYQTISR